MQHDSRQVDVTSQNTINVIDESAFALKRRMEQSGRQSGCGDSLDHKNGIINDAVCSVVTPQII
jgi:hypothetical protein